LSIAGWTPAHLLTNSRFAAKANGLELGEAEVDVGLQIAEELDSKDRGGTMARIVIGGEP
jgi:hypothetical protein